MLGISCGAAYRAPSRNDLPSLPLQGDLQLSLPLGAMPSITRTSLSNGLPLYRISVEGARSTTILVAFDAGARTERPDENGMAHFLEHLVFKGGEKYRTYRDVNEPAERIAPVLDGLPENGAVEELFTRFPERPAPEPYEPAPALEPRTLVRERESNQSHLRMSYRPAIGIENPKRRAALAIYSTLLGGSMGSRLF